ncbi:hypothetical protein CTI12_AA047100 [Artemisia annua]|uniref:RNA-directed DNA polymerase, eukaryota, Reverse transcriptase zinc-binding domain protein n=1 Tax=Artemisia annua TaxID=35608 RepID=A0A2U1QCR4_ARTAN|nr:hypothetical protein CTI12_AA047100 [Artemisia annua]
MPLTVNKRLESLGSNFFWGSDEKTKKISWISWKIALASKDKEGLGIGSLFSLNHALIQKWRWRFINNPHALWTRLIVAVHGLNEDSSTFFNHIKSKGIWYRIVGSINSMHEKDFIPISSMQRRVNNGAATKFWHDTWTGRTSLKSQFPRLFRLSMNRDCMVRDCWDNGWHLEWTRDISRGTIANQLDTLQNNISGMSLKDIEDTWAWTIGTTSFSVKSVDTKLIGVFFQMGRALDGIAFFQRRLISLFGGLFVIASLPGGISVVKELKWFLLLVQFVIMGLNLLIILYGTAH